VTLSYQNRETVHDTKSNSERSELQSKPVHLLVGFMAGRKQRGRGGGRGYRGVGGFGRGGGRGGRGGGGSGRGRGRGRWVDYLRTDDIDDNYVVRTSSPSFWLVSFMVRALQAPGITRGVVRRLRTQGDRNAREEDANSALITSRTTQTPCTTATSTTARGSRLPIGEPVMAVARLVEKDINVGAVLGASLAQT
jgi:hypothetical protein